ncbi:hypothetical protein [Pseudogracilibacillus sp. SO30301A]|uniref:hypothetical protein n=1 Tax=Pseudogracilibacillus sp. SO30301A TaxID=3098291 RepID=UPI00300E33FE
MYQIREILLKNGTHEVKRKVIEFDDSSMQIVGEFLMADAPLLGGEILQEIDSVLTGERDVVKSSGNRCSVSIQADITLLEDLFEIYPPYNIDTKKLRDLTEMWLDKLCG